MDWTRGGRIDSFYGVLVDPHNLDIEYEHVEIGEVSLSANYYTDERITGTMAAPADFSGVGNRLLRICMESTLDGKTETTEVGTFFMRRMSVTTAEGTKTRDIELHSCIWKFITDGIWENYSRAPGTDVIQDLQTLSTRVLGQAGKIEIRSVKTKALREALFWKGGTRYLKALNWYADYLGAEALNVDGHGRCFITPYIAPDKRQALWTFEDGVNCIYEDEVIADTNEDDIPNSVAVVYDQDDYYYRAGRLLPASSPYSFQQRGRWVDAYFEHNDFTLDKTRGVVCTRACKLYAAKDTTSEVVHDLWAGGQATMDRDQEGEWIHIAWQESSWYYGWTEARNFFQEIAVENKVEDYYSIMASLAISIEISHPYAPIKIGDAVRYKRGATDIIGIVHAMEMELTPGFRTQTVIDVVNGALGDVYP